MSEKRWTIGRPINGVSLNDLEYLCDNAGRQLMYDSEESARADLRRYGYSDKRIEDEGIVICCFNAGDYMASLEKRNEEFEARIAELEKKHWNECGQIAHYSDELRRTKELLKVAMDDMTKEADCGICLHDNDGECPIKVTACKFKWRHADEALALIGEDTNVPAREDGEQMAEYISKQSIIDYLNGYLHSIGEGGADSLLFDRGQRRALINSIQDISAVEAADVQPVKHGRWEQTGEQSAKCTACGGVLKSNGIDKTGKALIFNAVYHYCPYCGARMDGGAENG